jgi:hypothetical protein
MEITQNLVLTEQLPGQLTFKFTLNDLLCRDLSMLEGHCILFIQVTRITVHVSWSEACSLRIHFVNRSGHSRRVILSPRKFVPELPS